MTLSYNDMVEIVSHISYKPGWFLTLGVDNDGKKAYLQINVDVSSDASLCSSKRDGTRVGWKSGKRYLSEHMCKQEIVGVAFDLFKSAELHEVHEWFRYHNRSIYNPHLDPDKLADFASRRENYITRENAMSMTEDEKK